MTSSDSGLSYGDDVLNDQVLYTWVWEYLLRHTSGECIVKALEGGLENGFPTTVSRLCQMRFLQELNKLHDNEGVMIDVELTLHQVCNFENSLLQDAAPNVQPSEWGPGFEQKSLKTSSLHQSFMILKEDLRGFKGKDEGRCEVQQTIRRLLKDFTRSIWPLFGHSVLTQIATDVVARRKQELLALASSSEETRVRLQNLQKALRRQSDLNAELRTKIEVNIKALRRYRGETS